MLFTVCCVVYMRFQFYRLCLYLVLILFAVTFFFALQYYLIFCVLSFITVVIITVFSLCCLHLANKRVQMTSK